MRAEYHAALGGIAAGGLAPALGVNSLVFFAASFLIDFDHYLDYIYRNKLTDFSVRRMFRFYSALDKRATGRPCVQLSVFHTIEFLLLAYAVAALTGSPPVYAALWGMLFHMVLDLADMCRSHALFARAFSLIEYAVRWNRLKSRGMHPELPYDMALSDTLTGRDDADRRRT